MKMMVHATIEKKNKITMTTLAISPAPMIIPINPLEYTFALDTSISLEEITTNGIRCKEKGVIFS